MSCRLPLKDFTPEIPKKVDSKVREVFNSDEEVSYVLDLKVYSSTE